jgi:hypothetical protein
MVGIKLQTICMIFSTMHSDALHRRCPIFLQTYSTNWIFSFLPFCDVDEFFQMNSYLDFQYFRLHDTADLWCHISSFNYSFTKKNQSTWNSLAWDHNSGMSEEKCNTNVNTKISSIITFPNSVLFLIQILLSRITTWIILLTLLEIVFFLLWNFIGIFCSSSVLLIF